MKVSIPIVLFLCAGLYAQSTPVPPPRERPAGENMYISANAWYPLAAGSLAADFTPYPGFKIGVGYTWRNWSFGLEGGWNFLKAKPSLPFTDKLTLIPVQATAAYTFTFFDRLELTPKLAAGVAFSRLDQWNSAADRESGNSTASHSFGFMGSAALEIGYAIIPQSLSVFVQAGISVLPERTDSALVLGDFAAGIRLYPGRLARGAKESRARKVALTGAQEQTSRTWNVFFTSDGYVLDEKAKQVLANFAAEYKKNPAAVYVAGYAAPAKDRSGQLSVSYWRVMACADYLKTLGVDTGSFVMESLGSDSAPLGVEAGAFDQYRCVQITLTP